MQSSELNNDISFLVISTLGGTIQRITMKQWFHEIKGQNQSNKLNGTFAFFTMYLKYCDIHNNIFFQI